jgi:hypothetical protein
MNARLDKTRIASFAGVRGEQSGVFPTSARDIGGHRSGMRNEILLLAATVSTCATCVV